jgi:hypothetical protein
MRALAQKPTVGSFPPAALAQRANTAAEPRDELAASTRSASSMQSPLLQSFCDDQARVLSQEMGLKLYATHGTAEDRPAVERLSGQRRDPT